jgi:hypothetical protein
VPKSAKTNKSPQLVIDAQSHLLLSISGPTVHQRLARGAVYDAMKARVPAGSMDVVRGIGKGGVEAEIIINMRSIQGERRTKLLDDLQELFSKHHLKYSLEQ